MWNFKFKSFLRETNPDDLLPVLRKGCDITGCPHLGDFKAPKSRYDLKSYYWFCIDHVRDYNANWDFFKGMSREEIEHHMHKTAVWDRPTWRSTQAGFNEEKTRQRVYEAFTRGESVSPTENPDHISPGCATGGAPDSDSVAGCTGWLRAVKNP